MPLTILIPAVVILVSAVLAYRSLRNKTGTFSNKAYENVILEIKVPRKSDEIKTSEELKTAPIASENMFASLHGLLKMTPEDQEQFSFEIESSPEGIRFYVAVPPVIRSFIESQIYAQYPDATIKECEDYVTKRDRSDQVFMGAEITLSRPQFFPIKTFKDFEVDPISAITSALSEIRSKEELWFQVLVRPVPDTWQEEGHEYVKKLREGTLVKSYGNIFEPFLKEIVEVIMLTFKRIGTPAYADPTSPQNAKPGGSATPMVRLSPGQELEIKAIENKLTKMGFETTIRVVAVAGSKDMAEMRLRSIIASLKQFSTANLNGFVSVSAYDSNEEFIDMYQKRVYGPGTYVLNVEELASVFHLPTSAVETPTIAWSAAKKGEPPLNLPQEGSTILGVTNFRNKQTEFGIKDEDRLRHMYLIGKTGSGKSQLFRNMIIQDMRNGKGVGVMDPHGTLIDELLEMVPDHRLDDVVIFDPSDEERPVALNMLEVLDSGQKNLMASGIVSAIKQHFGTMSWGPRLEYLLNISVLTLLEVEGTTLLGITRLLTDDNYRKFILHYVKDPVIKEFWAKEFMDMKGNSKLVTEAVAPIQNKIGRFLSSSTIRNILGRPKSTIRIDDIMNTNKIFFINLSKGKIGDDNANLLGSLLVSRMQFGAMQRAKVPEAQRIPFYLFVDEFQNFASGSFESILSEARKYKLALHVTHQYTSQVPEEVLGAVFGNVGTMIALAIGAPDAEVIGREYEPVFTPNDLINQERQHMYLKLMIDGMTSSPFSAFSLTRITGNTGNGPRAIELSREKYGQEREYVEEKIRAWVERKFDLGMAIAEENRRKKALEDAKLAAEAVNASQPSQPSVPVDQGHEANVVDQPESGNQVV